MPFRGFMLAATAAIFLTVDGADPPSFEFLLFSAIGSSATAEEHRPDRGVAAHSGEHGGNTGRAVEPMMAGAEVMASDLIGQPLYSTDIAAEEQIGQISDLMVDQRGTIPGVIVDIGKLLGIAEHEIVIPFDELEFRPDPDHPARTRLYIAASRKELERAPIFGAPVQMAAPPAAANGGAGSVRTSRTFLGPHEFPPERFAAYGIVAFPALPGISARSRHVAACNAYVATLPTPTELFVPESEQMVTVWPVDDPDLASELVERRDPEVCETAVDRYDLTTALSAIRHARLVGEDSLQGSGPFLLAWSPSSEKGEPDALVLVADLTTAVTSEHFEEYFRHWREDIELSPELWDNGWSVSLIRARIRDWADRWGPAILNLTGG